MSVLFADLVGFTTFAEDRDAEEVRELLTRYFDLAREVIAPLRRHGREVHRRRRHGGLGRADRARGRRRASRPGGARAGRRGPHRSATDLAGARRRADRRGGRDRRAPTDQGMVAGDLVNTASRLQSVAPPGTVLVGEATQRAAAAAIVFEAAGEQVLKGKAAPGAGLAGGARRGRARRARPVGARSRRRSSAATRSCGCSRTCSTPRARAAAAAGLGHRARRHRQEPPRLGVPEVHRRRCVETSAGTTAARPAYGEGITFWALGEMVRERAGLPRTTTRRRPASRIAATLDGARARRGRAALDRARAARAARASASRRPAGARSCSPPGGRSSSGSPATAPVVLVFEDLHWADAGPARLHRPPARVEPRRRRSTSSPWPGPSSSSGDRTGAPASATSPRSTSSRCRSDAMRELLAGLVPGPARRRPCDAIVARAEGIPLYAVETVRMLLAEGRLELRRTASTGRSATSTTLAVPETLHALIAARLDALDAGRPDARSRTRRSSARASRSAALAAVTGAGRDDLEPRLRGARPARAAARSTSTRARPSAASTPSSRRSSARSPTTRWPSATARRATSPRRATSSRSATTSWPAVLAATTCRRLPGRAEGPEAEALAAQARLALRGAAERARALGSHEQALAFLEQAARVDDRSGRARRPARADAASPQTPRPFRGRRGHPPRGLEDRRQLGDRPAIARAIVTLASSMISAYRIARPRPSSGCEQRVRRLAGDPAYVGIVAQRRAVTISASEDAAAVDVADRGHRAGRPARHHGSSRTCSSPKAARCARQPRDRGARTPPGRARSRPRRDDATALRAYVNLTVFLLDRPGRGLRRSRVRASTSPRRIGNRSQWVVLVANGSRDRRSAPATGTGLGATLAELADIDARGRRSIFRSLARARPRLVTGASRRRRLG